MAPLLSRALDPILGVFTGGLAYYLYETNPRTAPPERDRLVELIKWKRAKSQQAKEGQSNAADEEIDWKALASEVERK
ncbi:hypothetical protein NM688_g6662 [Phlebia brevispora]|uniref:Uncharacterized protein n=1 Tax=Phlebia brevispora TaxID=194682 RepID=A0ACC1SDN1_9APHY|nr:hypothetical protein NM688_g6662 [Phlebia brevispora]